MLEVILKRFEKPDERRLTLYDHEAGEILHHGGEPGKLQCVAEALFGMEQNSGIGGGAGPQWLGEPSRRVVFLQETPLELGPALTEIAHEQMDEG